MGGFSKSNVGMAAAGLLVVAIVLALSLSFFGQPSHQASAASNTASRIWLDQDSRGGTTASGTNPITVSFTAVVASVNDDDSLLGNTIKVDDEISGAYTYDPTTADSNALPTRGEYSHTTVPFGICVEGGGLVFETDPNNVDFVVSIEDGFGSPLGTLTYCGATSISLFPTE